MATTSTADLIVIGGGIMGLSIAYESASAGASVTLLERGEPGKEASWAGAGVLPPASWYVDHPALDALALTAADEHAHLSVRLHEATGIDDEYTPCGATYVETPSNRETVRTTLDRWRALGVAVEATSDAADAWRVPGEAQVRNPRRLAALAAACRRLGVRIVTQATVERFEVGPAGSIHAAATRAGSFAGGAYCVAAGAWSPPLLESLGIGATGRPVRGQMLLLNPGRPTLETVVHRYPFYAVPRRDGRVLVGATVEEVGFDKTTTTLGKDELLAAAVAIEPALAEAPLERHWAGLRPASGDLLPLIGAAPGCDNLWLATGHHRSGLQLSPPTARILGAMIRGETIDLPVAPFDPSRFANPAEI